MPNGRPFDHWYTDICLHGIPALSPTADAIISLASEGDRAEIHAAVEKHIKQAGLEWPMGNYLWPDGNEPLERELGEITGP